MISNYHFLSKKGTEYVVDILTKLLRKTDINYSLTL